MLVVVNCRDLADATGHSHRQLAGRIYLSRKHFSYRLASHLTGLPDIHNRIHILLCPGKAVGPSGHEDKDGWLASRCHSLK